MCDIVVKKFTSAISSLDEFLSKQPLLVGRRHLSLPKNPPPLLTLRVSDDKTLLIPLLLFYNSHTVIHDEYFLPCHVLNIM